MADETKDNSAKSTEKLDLASLSGLDFGPNWADSSQRDYSKHEPRGNRPRSGGGSKFGGEGGQGRSGPRDRRGNARRSGEERTSPPREHGERPERGERHDRHDRHAARTPVFEPTVKIDIYPQDEAFDALVKRLQSSARTYQLFDITRLLLEKPERYVVLVSPKAEKSAGAPALLYYSIPGHLPFETESAAIQHVLSNHLDLFFDVEEVECDPPSGNFLMVNRCGITGTLLGPPNYHRYQEFCQKHFAAKITGMSYERFQSKIESTKAQEDIDAWLDSMKKRSRYVLKERGESEPEAFDTFESARMFLLTHRKDKIVASSESVRFAGKDLQRLPKGDIRRSVEAYVEQQKHFPLDTANNIRGRLRRHNFTVYKKGSKGASFVCAVKRKFRDEKTTFTDSIRNLIDFIEKHPDLPASKLPKLYIGVDTEKQQPEVLKMTDEPVQQAKPTDDAETPVAPQDPQKADEIAPGTESPAPSESESDANAPVEPVAPVVASTDAQPKSELSSADQAKLRQLMLDLRWLITEGYVTEYGDGRLYTPPPMPPVKKGKVKLPAKHPEPQAPKVTSLEETEGKPEVEAEDEPTDSATNP